MIAELGTYSLSDFLPFSRDAYFHLFAAYNAAVFPLQWVLLVAGLAALWSLRGHRSSLAATLLLLAGCWAWVAWAFHWQRYAVLNWAGAWFAYAFALGAVCLLAAAVFGRPATPRGPASPSSWIGPGIYATGVVLLPLAGLLWDRRWDELAWFGLAPTPTAMATLGLLLIARGPWLWPVWVLTGGWLAFAALQALAMAE